MVTSQRFEEKKRRSTIFELEKKVTTKNNEIFINFFYNSHTFTHAVAEGVQFLGILSALPYPLVSLHYKFVEH